MEQVRVDSETLEEVVDRIGLAGTLDLLSAICYEKADHIHSNWDGFASAAVKCWQRAGARIDKTAAALRD